jgi:alpha-L-fucosidase 2
MDTKNKLWYTKPARRWTQALPIGNGRMGAMIYGGPRKSVFQINEDTIWSGYPVEHLDHLEEVKTTYLPKVRTLIAKKHFIEAEKIIENKFLREYTQSYLTLGEIEIKFKGFTRTTNYYRDLDLSTAINTTKFTVKNLKHRYEFCQEVFSSVKDNAIFIKIESNGLKLLNFDIKTSCPLSHSVNFLSNNILSVQGSAPSLVEPNYIKGRDPIKYDKKGIQFQENILIHSTDGKISQNSGNRNLKVSDASFCVIAIVIHTNFGNYNQFSDVKALPLDSMCQKTQGALQKRNFDEIRQDHIEEHQKLFNRMEFDLGVSKYSHLPTNLRINRQKMSLKQKLQYMKEVTMRKSQTLDWSEYQKSFPIFNDISRNFDDLALVELLFQYGRYLLICSSRPGTQPANLQGIWNDKIRANWSSNFTLNINFQMNYWLAETCNLAECHEPMMDFIQNIAKTGTNTAKIMYDARGWCAHHNSDLWALSTPAGLYQGNACWAFWPMGGAWLSFHIWEKFLFNSDLQFLDSIGYNIMKENVLFCLDWLIEGENGLLITSPATSPENSYLDSSGVQCGTHYASTMDIAIIKQSFKNFLKASEILDKDQALREKIGKTYEKLSPFQISKNGYLLEWHEDLKEPEPGHRHLSHLIGLHPGDIISTHETPSLSAAISKSLKRRYMYGGPNDGWGSVWRLNLYSRLREAENAQRQITSFIALSLHPNLFNSMGRFQIDGNFGFTAGIAEMLIQSQNGVIQLLPALPKAWDNGAVRGIRARGGFTIDVEWQDSKLTKATVINKEDKICSVGYQYPIKVQLQGQEIITTESGDKIIQFPVRKNEEYIIT